MNTKISPSRQAAYLSPKLSKSPLSKFSNRIPNTQQQPKIIYHVKHFHTEANPQISKPMAESAHHIGVHSSRSEFILPPLIKRVQELTISPVSSNHLKQRIPNTQAQKSPNHLMVEKTAMTNRSRKLSYNQQLNFPSSPTINCRKSQFVTNTDNHTLKTTQTRDRKLSYQVSTLNIQSQSSFAKKQIHSFWPMSPVSQASRRQSQLLPGMTGRQMLFEENYFHHKNNENSNWTPKKANDEAKSFFPSFKNNKLRKNSQNQNQIQKAIKVAVPSFLLKKIHKQTEQARPQQNAQNFRQQRQRLCVSTSSQISRTKQRKLSLKDFLLIKQLGEGKFGKVLLVKQKASGFICAMKVFKKQQIIADNFMEQFIREMKIQLFLNHPNIIKMYGYLDDLSSIYILLEAAVQGTLYQFLENANRHGKLQNSTASISEESPQTSGLTGLNLKQTAVIMYQICSGVNYLHSHNIIHRDLKPQNVVMHQKTIKLCDFGWSVFKGPQMRTTFCGTPLYLCPELITGEEYDQKVDIWAIGIMLYEFLIGPNPFNIKQESDLANIIHVSVSLDKKDAGVRRKLDETVIDFINGCLNKDPIERLDIREIVNHKFFIKHCPELMMSLNSNNPRSSNLGMRDMMK